MNNKFVENMVSKYQLVFSSDTQFSEWELLQIHMRQTIEHLIDTNPEKLLHILYLLDVDELKVEQIFAQSEITEISKQLTELILIREFQRQKTARD
jgi:hypothetical protein